MIVKTCRIPTLLCKQSKCVCVCVSVEEKEGIKEGMKGEEDEKSYCIRSGQALKPSLIFRVKTSIFSHSMKKKQTAGLI